MQKGSGDMSGRVCMITGTTSGIGKATALGLAKMGATVILVARNEADLRAAADDIKEKTANESIDLIVADLSSQESIHRLAEDFRNKYQHLHVLINNAGLTAEHKTLSVDGIDTLFAVNYLAPFLLTNLLSDVLKVSAPSRIVNVSSDGHKFGRIDFDDIQSKKRSAIGAYGDSKLALNLFTYELARKIKGTGVTANALHPGVVATNIGSHDSSPFITRFIWKLFKVFMSSPDKGAQTSIFLASSPDVDGASGKYFVKSKETRSSKRSYDESVGQRLWQVSEELTKVST
ncbi:MAG: SDR family oxidoreductase [Thaumarchaeota archaeon]|nr:SDR family oxidoreductase [Nitrososphaerota archaeon]